MVSPLSQTQQNGFLAAEAIFGLDQSLAAYQRRLQAATAFGLLRGSIERNKTTLSTLTKRNSQKRKRDYFQINVMGLVQSGEVSRILLPLVTICSSRPERSMNWLLLALFSLTEAFVSSIKEHDLSEVFAELFPRVIGDFTIFQETREMFIDILRQKCNENISEIGQMVLNLLPSETSTKKRRLDGVTSEVEPLILKSESLVCPETVHEDTAPNLNPNRGVVFQFVAAQGDKLEGVLPGTSPFLQGIHTGRQWCWERQKDAESSNSSEMRTSAISAMIPDNDQADISFVLTVGYKAGWEIVQYLGFRFSETD
ncbi:hypothetical protein CABS01_16764 [Colletotrichum abscissum]|uniref:Uncharacterized protein n=1 Tax=Colletotrichum cuscutae TaxID=1209917 RepID=A0AAI9U3K7_9PEZI|nr:uncharacterized protein CABS01_16764 [Colletotrichum abscissum]KAK1451050.1 hypothetical protein CCUS01_11227 [Colletotrichum cuscutae]KAK1514235.1 hypothetical protein CABS01_16764 [Colletotrichum abscissum]